MVIKITREKAIKWKEAYEAGASLDDVAASACLEMQVSNPTVSKAIRAVGGTIRTYAETIAMKKKKREEELSTEPTNE